MLSVQIKNKFAHKKKSAASRSKLKRYQKHTSASKRKNSYSVLLHESFSTTRRKRKKHSLSQVDFEKLDQFNLTRLVPSRPANLSTVKVLRPSYRSLEREEKKSPEALPV